MPFRSSSSVSGMSLNRSLLVLNWRRRNRISPPKHCKKVGLEAPWQEAFWKTRREELERPKKKGGKVQNYMMRVSLSLRLCQVGESWQITACYVFSQDAANEIVADSRERSHTDQNASRGPLVSLPFIDNRNPSTEVGTFYLGRWIPT